MNKLFFTLVFFFSLSVGFTQQEAQFTQFMHNKLILNPAYAGERGVTSLTAIYRNQWIGFDGSPKSILMSFNSPFLGDRVGFGLSLAHYNIGILQSWFANMAYSYKLQIDKNSSVRVALQGNLRQLSYDFNSAKISALQRNDPSIDTEDPNVYKGNFGVGFYFTHKEFFVGASVPYFFENNIGFNGDPGIITATSLPHFYVMIGITAPVSEKIKIQPSLLTKYVKGAPFDMDVNVSVIFEDRISTGLSYRLGGGNKGIGESIDITLFYKLSKEFGAGMAYDFTLSELREYTGGSLEIIVRYDIVKGTGDIANPRFF